MAEPIKIRISKGEDAQVSPEQKVDIKQEQGKTSPQLQAVNAAIINVAKTALVQGVHIICGCRCDDGCNWWTSWCDSRCR